MSIFGGGNNDEAERARADENARQQRIRQGTSRINSMFDSQFDDEFFSGRRDAYLDFARPEVERQYEDANRDLTFSLARSGLLDSSVRGEKASRLQELFDERNQNIADEALSLENQSRNEIEGARSNLITTLNATGDQQGAVNSALTRASILSRPQTYSPIGQLFTDFTSTLGTQAAAERAYSVGGPAPRYNTGWFGGRGRVTVR